MFSLTKTIDKKLLFLPIILLSTFNLCCCKPNNSIIMGTKNNPIHIEINNQKANMPQTEASFLWEVGKLMGPVVAGAVINYALQKWNEDDEMISLTKEEKIIELQIKKHPDYCNIHILQQQSIAQEKINHNREKQLELNIKKAQLIQHHQDELIKFSHCDKTIFTEDFCNHMTKIHQRILEEIIT